MPNKITIEEAEARFRRMAGRYKREAIKRKAAEEKVDVLTNSVSRMTNEVRQFKNTQNTHAFIIEETIEKLQKQLELLKDG